MESFSSYQGSSNKEQDFQKLSFTIGTSIQKVTQNVSSMQQMINQIGTHQDSAELRKQLHNIQHYTQQLVKDTNGNLKDLHSLPPPFSQSEQRQRKMQKEKLQEDFTSALLMFQTAQRSAASSERKEVDKVKERNYVDPFASNKRENQLIELQDSTQSRQQMQQQMVQEEEELRNLEEQEQAIRKLEVDIQDVNQIFKDLGAMVHDQGDILDSIEASVEHSSIHVSQGVQQLREASGYKNKIRRKKLFLAIIAAVILSVIIIIIWASWSH